MPFASRGERRIHYEATGEGTPLMLLPGIGAGRLLFGTLPRRIARAGFRCITLDPVGVAPSSAHEGPYDLDAAAADACAVLDDVGIDRCAMVGTSLGGKVGLCLAADRPRRTQSLVMLASAAVATPRGKRVYRFMEIMARRLPEDEFGEVLATFLFGTTFHTRHPGVVDDIVRAMKLDDARRALMIAQARSLHGFDGAARTRRVACPTLCLAGAEDTLTGPDTIEATARRIAGARFERIEGAGHTLLLESATVLDRVLEFVSAAATGA